MSAKERTEIYRRSMVLRLIVFGDTSIIIHFHSLFLGVCYNGPMFFLSIFDLL